MKHLPQVLIMENVPQCVTSEGWHEWNAFLESLGYSNYCEVINAKNFEIPQNRERAFMVSILGDYNFNFKKYIGLKYKLKDFLEKDVDEKYYLTFKQIGEIEKWNAQQKPLENIKGLEGIIPTTTTRSGAYAAGMTLVSEKNNKSIKIRKVTNNYIEWEETGKHDIDCRAVFLDGVTTTTTTKPNNKVIESCFKDTLRIRKLTPRECFRFMGVKDEDFENCEKNQSETSLYHLAGDSIVTTCLMMLFGELFQMDYVEKIKELVERIKEK